MAKNSKIWYTIGLQIDISEEAVNFPIFNLMGTEMVSQLNVGSTLIVMAAGLIGLLIAIAEAADVRKSTDDRKVAGQIGIWILICEVLLLLVGLFPILTILAMAVVLANVANLFSCAFGKPLW